MRVPWEIRPINLQCEIKVLLAKSAIENAFSKLQLCNAKLKVNKNHCCPGKG
jgi:hypothetical protein